MDANPEVDFLMQAVNSMADRLSDAGKKYNAVELGVLAALIHTWNIACVTETVPELAKINKAFMIKHQDTVRQLREFAELQTSHATSKSQ